MTLASLFVLMKETKSKLYLAFKTKDRTLLEFTADNIPLDRKSTGLANRIFLEAEGYD